MLNETEKLTLYLANTVANGTFSDTSSTIFRV